MPIRRLFSENIKLFFQLFIATVMGDFGEPNAQLSGAGDITELSINHSASFTTEP